MREIISLNKNWIFTQNGQSTEVNLPHTWNAVDGQDGGNDYYRGTCLYTRTLDKPVMEAGTKVFLEVCGAAMSARVSLNGEQLASHQGGYSAFRVELTEYLRDSNELAISVDNSDNDIIYPQKADFTFYGGLYRDVNLILVPEVHFDLSYCGAPGIKVTPVVDLHTGSAQVTVETWQVGQGDVTITINGQSQRISPEGNHATTVFTIENVHLWDGVEDPYLYTATATLDSGDQVTARFGCRHYEINAEKGFLLNGRSYPLRGVSRHQDHKGVGNALTLEHHRQDMAIVRELGANTLRLAHYQHAQEFYDLCDENGIIVWAEIPYITMHMKNGRENTLSQMEELVAQCYNHPSIVVWGLSNEITAASAVNEDLLENHRLLNELCHKMDATRPTTMANVFMLETDSPILDIPDVNSYNLYFGWYLGELEQNEEFFDEYHSKYPDRPIGFSEYGADANPQFQNSQPEKGDYSESYQAVYHEHMLEMIEKRPWLWATHVWNLFDFAADGRDEGGKHGENQKGLVTFDRRTRKDAFYLYKAAWNKKPMVHICGSRYVDRAEDVTEVKVYSNADQVSLYVDGQHFAIRDGHRIFRFQVPISGEHVIEAKAAGQSESIQVRRVEKENPDYIFVKKQDVVNWFDQEALDPNYFSVSDTLADLRANPEAGAIVEQMMAKGAASRGDVAESVKDNPALQRMMGRMTLISLLKQAGNIEEESIRQLNRVLQGIKKS
ncbi:MAG: glycoside hydrolase family 2 protein [Acetatifactor sp.]|nr:glycoside hydrolase family 2 protein [Acetatifactor sp.]